MYQNNEATCLYSQSNVSLNINVRLIVSVRQNGEVVVLHNGFIDSHPKHKPSAQQSVFLQSITYAENSTNHTNNNVHQISTQKGQNIYTFCNVKINGNAGQAVTMLLPQPYLKLKNLESTGHINVTFHTADVNTVLQNGIASLPLKGHITTNSNQPCGLYIGSYSIIVAYL